MTHDDEYYLGVITAAQFIALDHDQPSMVSDMFYSYGLDTNKLLKAQRQSGYQSRKMCPIIRDAKRRTDSSQGLDSE